MLNVLKVRIYPNKEQELALTKNFGCVRFVWNYYLNKTGSSVCVMQWTGVIRDGTLI
jgi:transposase